MKQLNFEIKETCFNVNGEQIPLLCGEIHYFRMPRDAWENALDLLVEAGCNAVAYYVPWFVHEYEEGKFDFDGRTHDSNDLHAFIELTIEKGLMGYVRPGPYVYAETTDLGIPRWFTKKYKDAKIKHRRNGSYQETDFANCSAHNHPDFLAAVSRWYEAVCKEIGKYQAPNGNIVMFQLCNEIPGDDYDDENPVNLGMGDENGIWPSYLRKTYQSIDTLNQCYHTAFEKFEEVYPHLLKEKDASRYKAEQLSYYYEFYYPTYFRRLKEITDANGINVQLTHNAYNPRAVSLHYQNKKENPWLSVGLDCYYSLSGRLGMKDATYFCEFGAEYAKSFLKNVPWVIEQESGYWNDVPAVYGPELYIYNIWTIASGYQGMNLYMFAGGENRKGMGFYGTYHGWQAPVDKNGEKTETYEDVKQSLRDILTYQDTLLKPMVHDIAFGMTNRPGLIWEPLAKVSSDAFVLLKSAGFTPMVCDYEAMECSELWEQHKSLYVISDDKMREETQRKLSEYVREGGTLILQGRVPGKNCKNEPCTILADALSVKGEDTPFGDAVQAKILLDEKEYWVGNRMQTLECEHGKVLAWDEKGLPCVQLIKSGKGQVMLLPFAMELTFFEQAKALTALLAQVGVTPMIKGSHMLRVLPKEGGELVVLNLHPVKVTEQIGYEGKDGVKEWSVTLEPHSFRIMKY